MSCPARAYFRKAVLKLLLPIAYRLVARKNEVPELLNRPAAYVFTGAKCGQDSGCITSFFRLILYKLQNHSSLKYPKQRYISSGAIN